MLCDIHAMKVYPRSLEVVGHVTETLGADKFHIGVVSLILRHLSINETLSDVKDNAVLHRSMGLQPPRVFP